MKIKYSNEKQMTLFGVSNVSGDKPLLKIANGKTLAENKIKIAKVEKKEKKANHVSPLIWRIYSDGASRGNPGPSGAGACVVEGDAVIAKEGVFLGNKTNNQAEYLALLLGIFLATQESKKLNLKPRIQIIADSELLVRQVKGIYKVRNALLMTLKKGIEKALDGFDYRIDHVLRHNNAHADELANLGIDKKRKISTAFVKFLSDYSIKIEDL
jgi:ribonuclease HI